MSPMDKVTILGIRAAAGKARLRDGQKPYTLPAAIGAIPAGTMIGVDQEIPDAILDRLNTLPLMDCISTCAGGHRSWHLSNGVEKPTPAPKGWGASRPRWDYPAVLFGRQAKVCFNLVKTGTEETAQPGRFTLPRVGNQYRIYQDGPYIWFVAPMTHAAPPEWWEGLCQILEAAKFVEADQETQS